MKHLSRMDIEAIAESTLGNIWSFPKYKKEQFTELSLSCF